MGDGYDLAYKSKYEVPRVITVTDSTLTVSRELHEGKIVVLDRAAGIAVTLPASQGEGDIYTFVIKTAVSSNSTTIKVANASDAYTGQAFGTDDDVEGATGYNWNAETNDDTVTLDGTTTGGKAGDKIVITDYASNVFDVEAKLTQSGGSEVTPFSATVS